MSSSQLAFGSVLALVGGALIAVGFGLEAGDGMFGRLPEKAAFCIVGVILFIPGVAMLIRGARAAWNQNGGRFSLRAMLIALAIGFATYIVRK